MDTREGYLTVTDYREISQRNIYFKTYMIFQCTGYISKSYLSETVKKSVGAEVLILVPEKSWLHIRTCYRIYSAIL